MTSDGAPRRSAQASAAPSAEPTVLAAGGIVLHTLDGAPHVLVVHRPAYDDWSLPKGHVDDGEGLEGTAVREVTEETGIAAHIVRSAGATEHHITRGGVAATKRVHWYVMRPEEGTDVDPASRTPDAEVDQVAWWPVHVALKNLTHAGERDLLARTVGA